MSTHETFEDRLLVQLRHVVAERPAPAVPVPAARRPVRARLTGLAMAAAAACVAAVVLLVTGGGGADPAYALSRSADGTVDVTISSLRDAAGLQSKLRAEGVPAVVDYSVSPSCPPPPPAPAPDGSARRVHLRSTDERSGPGPSTHVAPERVPEGAAGAPATTGVRRNDDGSTTFSIDPGALPAGAKVYISTSGDDGTGRSSIGVLILPSSVSAAGGCPG